VSWTGKSAAKRFSMTVTAPAGTGGTIAVPTYGAAHPVVTVNGHAVWSGGRFRAGARIGGAHQDGGYVYLTGVPAGTFAISAQAGR
jgi:alpha-L-rhamnosidase